LKIRKDQVPIKPLMQGKLEWMHLVCTKAPMTIGC
jgi:hypothetical protein